MAFMLLMKLVGLTMVLLGKRYLPRGSKDGVKEEILGLKFDPN